MSTYIHFTEEQKQRAASVDLEEFLRCRGEKLLASGREKRLARDHSVTIRGNEWYDHAEERGGHAVSFVQRFYHLSYPEAVTMLLGGELRTVYPSAEERVEEPPKPFVLPPANSNMRRVYAYLVKHRNIDRSVVAHFAREKLLYEDADYHNAVFVGTDEDGVPRHAHKRSANSFGKAFRLNVEGCDPPPQLPPHRHRWEPLCVRSSHRYALLHHAPSGELAEPQLCGLLRYLHSAGAEAAGAAAANQYGPALPRQ